MLITTLTLSLVLMAGGPEAEGDSKEVEIKTSEGTVRVQQSQVEATPQKITPLKGDQLKQLASLPKNDAFVKHYKPDTIEPTLVDYDEAFIAWQKDKTGKYSADDVVMIVGGYLGNRCIADFDMQWVRVEDEYGTDFAVRAKKSEVMIFPFSSVQKRVNASNSGFVHGVYHALKNLFESGNHDPRDQP